MITPAPCATIEGSARDPGGRRPKVLVERVGPLAVVEHREAASRRRGAADDVHDDVDSAQAIVDSLRDRDTAFGGRYVRRDELTALSGGWGRERAVVRTIAPASRRVATTASPTPLVPPVTSARFPWSSGLPVIDESPEMLNSRRPQMAIGSCNDKNARKSREPTGR
jgi:hypothetical protein